MITRALRCLTLPPFHHDWKLAESLEPEHRQSAFSGVGPGRLVESLDPTHNEFQEFHMRCARCGADTWWRHSEEIRPFGRV